MNSSDVLHFYIAWSVDSSLSTSLLCCFVVRARSVRVGGAEALDELAVPLHSRIHYTVFTVRKISVTRIFSSNLS